MCKYIDDVLNILGFVALMSSTVDIKENSPSAFTMDKQISTNNFLSVNVFLYRFFFIITHCSTLVCFPYFDPDVRSIFFSTEILSFWKVNPKLPTGEAWSENHL